MAVHSFIGIVNLCRSKDIPLVFVYSPTLLETSLGGMGIVEKISKDYHIPFIDYRGDKRFAGNYTYFYDALHMNSYGAGLFSRDLSRRLNTIYK